MTIHETGIKSDLASAQLPNAIPISAERRASDRARRFLRNRPAIVGAAVLLALALAATFAPLLTSHNPNYQDLAAPLRGPGGGHLLGTDALGRDIYSRLLYGARVSLVAGVEGVAVAAGLGVPLGLIAGFFGRGLDWSIGLINDSLLSVPGLVLALAAVAALGPGLTNAMLAVGLVMMPRFYRLARASTRSLKEELFVRASVGIGCSQWRVLFAHILPNAVPPLIVQVSFVFGSAMLAEASLSFLGAGVQPPTASWGAMLADAAARLDQPHLLWPPALVLTTAVLASAFLADGVRDALTAARKSP